MGWGPLINLARALSALSGKISASHKESTKAESDTSGADTFPDNICGTSASTACIHLDTTQHRPILTSTIALPVALGPSQFVLRWGASVRREDRLCRSRWGLLLFTAAVPVGVRGGGGGQGPTRSRTPGAPLSLRWLCVGLVLNARWILPNNHTWGRAVLTTGGARRRGPITESSGEYNRTNLVKCRGIPTWSPLPSSLAPMSSPMIPTHRHKRVDLNYFPGFFGQNLQKVDP